MPTLYVLQVFLGDDGRGGNPLGVFLEGERIAEADRQAVAAELGFSETVFVDDPDRGVVRIFTPTHELPLAGHPLVGAAWLLAEHGHALASLRPPAGEVPTWQADGVTWIRARPESPPVYELRQLGAPAEVDAHPGAREHELLQVWAWESEPGGRARARVFPRAIGIEEDEATGKAALQLGAQLGRAVTIHQGVGSRIWARPGPGGTAEIGGRSRLVESRSFPGRTS